MYIRLQDLIAKHNIKITGIIHAGAHHGQEYDDYKASGVEKIIFIEPCYPAFKVLKEKFLNTNGVILVHSALGAYNGEAEMNVEVANTGQSNSILKPKKHLEQFPSITFPLTEMVKMQRLDDLMATVQDDHVYNFLNMDVQGYELQILKGAGRILDTIKYVYTEVNTDEIYENCARMEEIDQFLKDFDRVETNMAGGNWGDAFYIRKGITTAEITTGSVKLEFDGPQDPAARVVFLEKRLWRIAKTLNECGFKFEKLEGHEQQNG